MFIPLKNGIHNKYLINTITGFRLPSECCIDQDTFIYYPIPHIYLFPPTTLKEAKEGVSPPSLENSPIPNL
jgi:hypothetical protein